MTYVWEYDNSGNILSKETNYFTLDAVIPEDNYAYTRYYTYESGTDRMLTFKGQEVVYDEIGNPTTYRGKTLTWQNGRQLATMTVSGVTYTYTYNSDGLRIGKSGNGVTTEYILNGSQVIRQIIATANTTYVADYIYHENGIPMTFAYYPVDGTPVYYLYESNLQGDVLAVYDENGNKIVGFLYDAWGIFNSDKVNTSVCTDTSCKPCYFVTVVIYGSNRKSATLKVH